MMILIYYCYLREVSKALERHRTCALFLCIILIIPGGCSHASPSTCTGTPSEPKVKNLQLIMVERIFYLAIIDKLPNILICTFLHWAIRCLCKFIKREAAIWADPKTATTSKTRSSKLGGRKGPPLSHPQKFVPPMKLGIFNTTIP